MTKRATKGIVCDVCSKVGARVRCVSETHGKGKNLLVIENIPMVSCPHCGESYFSAETLHDVERLKRHRRELAVHRRVGVLALPLRFAR